MSNLVSLTQFKAQRQASVAKGHSPKDLDAALMGIETAVEAVLAASLELERNFKDLASRCK